MAQTTTPDSRSFRTEEPVSKVQLPTGDTAWLVTRYEDVRTVLSSPVFSADGTRPGFPTLLPGQAQILRRRRSSGWTRRSTASCSPRPRRRAPPG